MNDCKQSPQTPGTVLRSYADLRRGDEFNTYYAKSWQRCRVASFPKAEGNCVEFFILPVRKRSHDNDRQLARFVATTQVEVWVEKLTPELRVTKSAALDAEYEAIVLRVLTPGMGLRTTRHICDLASEKLNKQRLVLVCNRMADRGLLRKRSTGRGIGLMGYRQPIPQTAGIPVIENPGTRSQRLGWIREFKLHRPTQSLQPVCQWLDGSYSFSSDEMLEIVEDKHQKQQIAIAQQMAQGIRPEGFVEIPDELLLSLRFRVNSRGLIKSDALTEIAKAIGLAGPDMKRIDWTVRNRIVDLLQTYYPGWQNGRMVLLQKMREADAA